jgi:XTP/dITP diphosphohydrolase
MCLADAAGHILAETRGSNGFGYDPLLYLPDRGCSSAELSPEEKNARSHRGEAARRLARHQRQS